MLAKITSKNQITIPKQIMDQLDDVTHFDVQLDKGALILKPVRFYETNLEKIRSKIEKLGIGENTVAEAVKWARRQ
jgi:bifunctional DNA-binding transcriptional regulator/antitoxin component of YhaV-PrlF toxin-antitoxin module